LIGLLSSGSPDSVHGAMQVFTEFIKSDLTEDQILPVLRQLLPVLLNILGSTEVRPSALFFTTYLRIFWQDPFSPNPISNRIGLPSMCHRFVYGQGSASSGRERSHCFSPPSLARRVQGSSRYRPSPRCSTGKQLGWSDSSHSSLQSISYPCHALWY